MTENELYHYGVKGMKWGVRRTPKQLGHKTASNNNKKLSGEEYQNLSFNKRKSIAQKHGTKALSNYMKIHDKYDKQIDKAFKNEDFDTASKLDAAMTMEIYKKVSKPLYDAGYEWVSNGVRSDGFLSLQFGRSLMNTEYTEFGKRYVDDFMIDNRNKNVYETADW